MVNSHSIKFLLGKLPFYTVFSDEDYDQLKFLIFAWLGLNPDYAPVLETQIREQMSGPEIL
jgi:hypothetical protein